MDEADSYGDFLIDEGLHDATGASFDNDSVRPLESAQRKPKVVVSEKRRLQNRRAQKSYRLKQKQRVQALESLVRDGSYSSLLGCAEDVGSTSNSVAQIPDAVLPGLGQNEDAGFHGEGGFSQCTNANASFNEYNNTPRHHDQPCAMLEGPSASPHQLNLSDAGCHNSSHQVSAHPYQSIISTAHPAVKDSDGELLDQSLGQTLTPSLNLVHENREKETAPGDVLNIDLRSLEQNLISTGEVAVQPLNESLMQQHRQLPDLQANTIRVTQLSFISAIIHNAALLGLTAAEVSAISTGSPFYSAGIEHDTIVERAQALPANFKQDLKPTRNQLAYHHHPYIDALPFPTFRERVIALLQLNPPIFNQEDLCHDLQNGGLICWGSNFGTGGGNSGAPWDIRSWEARPWFMKKWWMLIGGIEAEMYQQTRWWCEMRGDRFVSPW